MKNQARVRLKPLGTLDAVVAAQAGQILGGLGFLVQLQMPGRQKVCLDLVDVAVRMSVGLVQNLIWSVQLALPSASPRLRLGALRENAHDGVWRSGCLRLYLLYDQGDLNFDPVNISLRCPLSDGFTVKSLNVG